MRKLLYILPVILILGFAACENYVDITPTGKKTVDSTDTYYELIALPNRAYHPAAFALLSDNVWSKESNIIGNEFISWDGINMTFNEAANRKELSDNNLYENCYTYILRSNIVISLVDASLGDKDVKELAKAEAKIMRAWDHFILINTFAKAYNPETAATDGGVAIIDKYDLEATPTKSTVAQVYDFIIKDIEEALPYLQEEPVNVYHPSKAFGYALAARVYLFHRDWKKAKEAAEESLKLNNTLIDYIDLGAKGGPTKVTTYAKGGNPEVLNYAYMGGPTEVLAFCYGMLSPEMVQLFGQNDERLNQFFKTSDNSVYYFDEGSGAALWNTSITYSKFQPMSVGMRTYHFFPLGKYLLRLTQYDIKIRIGSEPANIGMSSNQLHIRILNAEKHDRYLQRQRISTGKKSIESFITCCYNQIGLPVTGTLTKTTHNYFLGVECPKIGIKILRCYIHLQATFFKSFDQPLIKVAMPRSL